MISAGRLIPGFGTGWSPEEYEAVGVPMTERGERLDECLDVLEALWTASPAEHHGRHWDIAATYTDLKPIQRPRPPVYLGGYTPAALRRVARRADGWLPSARVPETFDSAALARSWAQIREEAERQGRDPDQLSAILRINATAGATPEVIATAMVRAGQETGIGHVFADLMYLAEDASHALGLASQVMEHVRTR